MTEEQTAALHLETIYKKFPEFEEWHDGDNYPDGFPESPELVDAIRVWLSVWGSVFTEPE